MAKNYRVEKVILFASYAVDNATEQSDIDIAIVSPDFRGKPETVVPKRLNLAFLKF